MDSNTPKKGKSSDLIKAEIPIVEKIIRDETWYEGERRGTPVNPNDPTVMSKVCNIISQNSDKIVKEAEEKLEKTEDAKTPPETPPATTTPPAKEKKD